MNQESIIVATTNIGKFKEIQAIFSEFHLLSLKELNYEKEIEEDGETFEENALKKARIISHDFNTLCLADDSGICIESLNGFPGVKTARFSPGTDHERNLVILEKMKHLPKEKRRVTFTVSIAMADPNLSIVINESLHGYVAESPRGNNGFGFDEIFELADGRTLAELSFEEKNQISCRRKALEKMKQYLYHS